MNFTTWFNESKDIFGFEKKRLPKPEKDPDDKPIKSFNTEYLSNYLSHHSINGKKPQVKFINRIYWGEGTGSLRTKVNVKFNVVLEKLNYDLQGTHVWYAKKAYQINRDEFSDKEEQVGDKIIEQLKKIDFEKIDSPKTEYKDFRNLVTRITQKMQKSAPEIFYYLSTRKVDDYQYIIRFGVRGHGLVDVTSGMRIEENQTNVVFYPERGMIRVTNYNINSPVGGPHSWELSPVDMDLNFFPTQRKEEVAEVIATSFRWY